MPQGASSRWTWLRRVEPLARPALQLRLWLKGQSLGVRALVVDAEGRVLLVEHNYLPGWHLPGGSVERGQTAVEAVAAELRQETGVEVTGPVQLLAVFDNRDQFRGNHVLLFRAPHWRAGPFTPSLEIRAMGFFAPDALPAGATAATRRRLAEVAAGGPYAERWRV